jgi:hypothetical protein
MNIRMFSSLYSLKNVKDECDEEVISGKLGQNFDHGLGKFGLVLEDRPSGPSRSRLLLSHRKVALQGAHKLIQEGSCESVLLFNPNDPDQANLAISLVGARRKRTVRSSPASLQNLVETPTHMPPQAVETTQSRQTLPT